MNDSFKRLVELSKKLRKECAWDNKETIESYSKYIMEEAEEIKDAIDKKDFTELKRELGDQLWNILFISNIAEEQGLFDFKDVLQKIHEKMIRRHPHVFDKKEATEDICHIETRYEEIKKIEKETPSTKQCLKYLEEVNLPDNIVKHSLLVNKISVFLAKDLLHKGKYINIDLVNASSLLHDIDKKICLDDKSKVHGQESYNMLVDKGHSAVADVVIKHLFETVDKLPLDTWEAKIVHYADKRVNNFKLVSLKERMEYIHNTYPHIKLNYPDAGKLVVELENEIFNELDFNPDELEQEMNKNGISTKE